MKHVRVTLQQCDAEKEPAPLVIDLVLGRDRKPAHNIPFAGWWGAPQGTRWIAPLVFQPSGIVNWGGSPEEADEERFSRMRLHETVFDLGTKLYMEHADGGVNTFVIKRVVDLDDLKDVEW